MRVDGRKGIVEEDGLREGEQGQLRRRLVESERTIAHLCPRIHSPRERHSSLLTSRERDTLLADFCERRARSAFSFSRRRTASNLPVLSPASNMARSVLRAQASMTAA